MNELILDRQVRFYILHSVEQKKPSHFASKLLITLAFVISMRAYTYMYRLLLNLFMLNFIFNFNTLFIYYF